MNLAYKIRYKIRQKSEIMILQWFYNDFKSRNSILYPICEVTGIVKVIMASVYEIIWENDVTRHKMTSRSWSYTELSEIISSIDI